jgi:hypothetical protein
MSALVFGVGVGLFLLIALWVSAFLLCVVSLRANKNAGILAVLSAALLTSFLLVLPIDSPVQPDAAPSWTPKVSLCLLLSRGFLFTLKLWPIY